MGLKKEIELENGVTLKYHRIASITKITNNTTIMEIASYTKKEKRDEEIEAIKKGQETGQAVPMDIFIHTTYFNKEYNEKDTIQDLYDYLKTTEMFADAEDI